MNRIEYPIDIPRYRLGQTIYDYGCAVRTNGVETSLEGRDIAVFAMGTNGGFSTASDYVAMVEKAVDALGTGKYIVCSPYGGTALAQQGVDGLQTLEAALAERFGARFFNWRKFLSEEGLDVEGLVPTSADNTAMEEGKCPPSLLADEVHPNDYGHDAIARRLFAMMDALGYLE